MGPYNNDWTGFNPDYHDVIVFDEYKGQLTIQELNRLCDKYTRLNTKGGSIAKNREIQICVFSNFDPADCYHKVHLERPDEL